MADQDDISKTIIFDLVQLEKLGAELERRWRIDPTTKVVDVLTHIDPEDHMLYVPQLTKLLEDLLKHGETATPALDDTKLDQPIDSGEALHHSLMATAIAINANPGDSKPASGKTSSGKDSSGNSGGKSAKDSAVPERIDQFRIIRELGAGAFGVVYLAEDESLQRKVAIKVPKVSDPATAASYLNEARRAAAIDCVGIVPIYHVGTKENGVPFVVQKLIDGPTLRFLLTRYGNLPPAHAVTILRDVSVALASAHRLGIYHRDLKPDNVLIDSSGVPWIADFGLAITESEQAQRKGEIAGTLIYMSPEQIKGRADWLDGRSDIWSLGIMLYELLLGKPPFTGKNRQALTEQICDREPRPLQQSSQSLVAINAVFKKCCAKNAGDRYASAEELTADLNELINDGLSTMPIDGSELRFEKPISQYASNASSSNRSRASAGSADSYASNRSTSPGSDGFASQASTAQGLSSQSSISSGTIAGQSTTSQPWQQTSVPSKTGHWPRMVMIGVGLLAVLAVGAQQWHSRSSAKTALLTVPNPDNTSPDEIDPGKNEIPKTPKPEIEPSDTNALNQNEANGTEKLPWIVASDGSGSHRTIKDAIVASEPGAHIHVKPGVYPEAIVFTQPLTLVGLGETPDECVISNAESSPLEIGIALGTVRVANFAIRGDGKQNKNEFNAIELTSGKLRLEKCHVRTSTFNGVKVQPGASLNASSCKFEDSAFFAISAKSPIILDISDCEFMESGVQVVEGSATIQRCTFDGLEGVYVEQSGENPSNIRDCHFTNCFKYGVVATTAGAVAIEESVFQTCKIGVQCADSDIVIKRCELSGCNFGVSISGGSVLVQDQTQISGGEFGCGMKGGKFRMVDSSISDLSASGIILGGSGTVELRDAKISRCGSRAITMSAGNLLSENCEFAACEDCGIVLTESFERARILKTRFLDNPGGAILVETGEVECDDCVIKGSEIGILAVAAPSQPIVLKLTKVSFENIKDFAARFENAVTATVTECTFVDVPSAKRFQAIGNAVVKTSE